MNREPFSGAATASCAPFFMTCNFCVQHVYLLNAHCIAAPHDRGNIMRIENIFQYDCQIVLPVGKNGLNLLAAFIRHNDSQTKAWSGNLWLLSFKFAALVRRSFSEARPAS